MSIKLITPCVGRSSCSVFKSAESLLETLGTQKDFKNLMMAMEIVKSWRRSEGCPFKVKGAGEREGFHVAICSIAATNPSAV